MGERPADLPHPASRSALPIATTPALIESTPPDGRVSTRLENDRLIDSVSRNTPTFDFGHEVTCRSSQGITAELVPGERRYI